MGAKTRSAWAAGVSGTAPASQRYRGAPAAPLTTAAVGRPSVPRSILPASAWSVAPPPVLTWPVAAATASVGTTASTPSAAMGRIPSVPASRLAATPPLSFPPTGWEGVGGGALRRVRRRARRPQLSGRDGGVEGSDGGAPVAASAAAAAAAAAATRMRQLDRQNVVGGAGAERLRRNAPCMSVVTETRRAFPEAWEIGGVIWVRV